MSDTPVTEIENLLLAIGILAEILMATTQSPSVIDALNEVRNAAATLASTASLPAELVSW